MSEIGDKEERNFNPHKEARLAMLVYGEEYASQRGGSMDFYDKQLPGTKKKLKEWVDQIENIKHRADIITDPE